jgi:anti-sigma factor RsiW
MSCSPIDVKDYFLGELPENRRRDLDLHLKTCQGCREELERFRATEAALLTLREEEVPQRIGFVSDKVFEPSAVRRWWNAFWGSAARLGFASAAMLSAAILVFALIRPAPAPPPPVPPVNFAKLEAELHDAIQKAAAESEARQASKLGALEKRHQQEQEALRVAFAENLDILIKRHDVLRASLDFEGRR